MKKLQTLLIMIIACLQALSLQAQYTHDYEYDGAGNRIRLNSPSGCSDICDCPAGRDDWLTLYTIPGGDNCPTSCEVAHSLNIPAEYNCYTHYKYEILGSLLATVSDGSYSQTICFRDLTGMNGNK